MKKFSSLYLSILFGMTATLFIACGDDEAKPPKSIGEILKTDPQFSEFKIYGLNGSELSDSLLNGEGPYTVFVPSNSAMENIDPLNFYLGYHLIEGAFKTDDLSEGVTYGSSYVTLSLSDFGNTILIEKAGSNIKLDNSANITTTNILASNGVIHVTDKALKPLFLTDQLDADPNLNSLQQLMLDTDNASLYSDLSPSIGGTKMIFAPNNAAFAAVADETGSLTESQMLNLLKYHIVYGAIDSPYFADGMQLTTEQGETLIVNISNDNKISLTDSKGNVANIVTKDVINTQGVIHIIDSVLFPENL